MRWRHADEHGFEYCYLFPDPGETDSQVVAAVAAASFNSAWPEGYGWELWDPTVEVGVDDVRDVLPAVFRVPVPGEGRGPRDGLRRRPALQDSYLPRDAWRAPRTAQAMLRRVRGGAGRHRAPTEGGLRPSGPPTAPTSAPDWSLT